MNFGKVKMLLKVDDKQKNGFAKFMLIGANIIFIFSYYIQNHNITPQIDSIHDFNRYIVFIMYQYLAGLVIIFSGFSFKALIDIDKYRNYLSFPLRYDELFLFVKLKTLRYSIITITINIINFFILGVKFTQSTNYYISIIVGLLLITFSVYIIMDLIIFLMYMILPSNIYLLTIPTIMALTIAYLGNTVVNVSLDKFYETSFVQIIMINYIVPGCQLFQYLLRKGRLDLVAIEMITFNIVVLVLLNILYMFLIKHVFYKILDKKDNEKAIMGDLQIKDLKSITPLKMYLKSEYLFLKRSKFGPVINKGVLAYIVVYMAVLTYGFYVGIFRNNIVIEFLSELKLANVPLAYVIIISLITDTLVYKYSTNSFSFQREYVDYLDYCCLDMKYLFRAKYIIKIILTFIYYTLLIAPIYILSLCDSRVIFYTILGCFMLIVFSYFNTLLEFMFANIYEKVNIRSIIMSFKRIVLYLLSKIIITGGIIYCRYLVYNKISIITILIECIIIFTLIAYLNKNNKLLYYKE